MTTRNVVVFKEAGRYGGWPANHGIWSWGNEILVGFEAGYFKQSQERHSIDWDRPAEHLLARSLDGGQTWTIEKHPELRPPEGTMVAGVPTEPGGKSAVDCPGGIDFSSPGFIFTARMSDKDAGPSRFYYSMNRGRIWSGPYKLPDFGQPGTAARTDYLIDGKHALTLFLTVPKANAKEGRVMVARTEDGAKTWHFVSWIGPEPEGDDYAIMPASVRLSPASVLTALRHPHRIDLWRSDDNLKSWQLVGTPAPDTGRGNPPAMIRLQDGRIAITYGYRKEPYGIRARLSSDDGRTWGADIILRADAGAWDIGYSRTVQRPDGKIVTIYYYNDSPDQVRYIGATIWDPGKSK
ncbi:MAG: sialidase family protein [Bryobacteraceae bacterium]